MLINYFFYIFKMLRKLQFKIDKSNIEEVKKIPGIGKGFGDKIEEFLKSGSIQRLLQLENNERLKTIDLFYNIWGCGPSTAKNLFNQGYRTLEELKDPKSPLNYQQRLGLKYYYDLIEKMPRSEVLFYMLCIYYFRPRCLKQQF